jgi:transcriptional regulator with XRE-family HTH domain
MAKKVRSLRRKIRGVNMNEFGMAFRRARLNSDMTFRDIANKVGKSIGYLSEIENGKKNPPDQQLTQELEAALGITDGHLQAIAQDARFHLPSNINNLVRTQPRLGILLKSCEVFLRDDRTHEEDKRFTEEFNKFITSLSKIRQAVEEERNKAPDTPLFSNSETFLYSGMEAVSEWTN